MAVRIRVSDYNLICMPEISHRNLDLVNWNILNDQLIANRFRTKYRDKYMHITKQLRVDL